MATATLLTEEWLQDIVVDCLRMPALSPNVVRAGFKQFYFSLQ